MNEIPWCPPRTSAKRQMCTSTCTSIRYTKIAIHHLFARPSHPARKWRYARFFTPSADHFLSLDDQMHPGQGYFVRRHAQTGPNVLQVHKTPVQWLGKPWGPCWGCRARPLFHCTAAGTKITLLLLNLRTHEQGALVTHNKAWENITPFSSTS